MPELVNPASVSYIPVPAQGRPVAPRPKPAAAPADPFRPAPGPPVLLLPHEDAGGPERQGRAGGPVRMAAQAPAGGIVVRGILYAGGERLPREADPSAQPPAATAPRPKTRTSRLRAALRKRRSGQ